MPIRVPCVRGRFLSYPQNWEHAGNANIKNCGFSWRSRHRDHPTIAALGVA
ncbi:hypothetical protein BBSC_0611 [Bifidobacterium scardovii JCM 12489 = DSM 13734]|nr:hypothetical protein BBSC_0611 [Bifidobacterium scardovii JCM 12489 = DSM 13734]